MADAGGARFRPMVLSGPADKTGIFFTCPMRSQRPEEATMRVYRSEALRWKRHPVPAGARMLALISPGYRYRDNIGSGPAGQSPGQSSTKEMPGWPAGGSVHGVEPGFCYSMGLLGSIPVGLAAARKQSRAYLGGHLKSLSRPGSSSSRLVAPYQTSHPLPLKVLQPFLFRRFLISCRLLTLAILSLLCSPTSGFISSVFRSSPSPDLLAPNPFDLSSWRLPKYLQSRSSPRPAPLSPAV
ncbi:hypothetical protein BO94DRAFT_317203 [Aspergillus sclerotioniger CBS 115572]|uniref:Uncharacterized protein n=1 Tax=Aspergillus sclerotioniger CBS 115572 TaxID=1450535 RepID=A0A317X629_9EURO|nr:hypothetical protein BO94DRAFT_317203 [Aspergillus sclerotioniger CBS 115572]PWY94019.1 hypothetical protein BO94DRAFT_317203 [Aspergillus sclerotioniger CBS 115572]